MPASELYNGIRRVAMDLLARREHAAQELAQKLARRFRRCDEINQVLVDLQADNLQSDARFAENFVRWRAMSGRGPLRIAAELKHRGVAQPITDEFLNKDDPEWFSTANAVRRRRFGDQSPVDVRARSRQARFLEQRGFTGSQVRRALDNSGFSI